MKITCERERMLAAFQTAAVVAPSRSPKPVLRNVRLEVGSPDTLLVATDLEVGLRMRVEGVDVEAPGSALLPVDRFGSILRENSDEQLRIEADGQSVMIRGDRSQFKLPAQDPHEFPEVATFEEECYHQVSARLLKELIRRTIFATDTESSRYALGGVLLEMEPERIVAVGTDGRRLAKMEGPAVSVGDHRSGESATIAPTRSMQLLERALSDADAEVRIAARANDLLVKTPQAVIFTRLVEGRFPRWRDVFPQRQQAVKVELTVGPLYSALRQAAIVANEESRGIDFTFGEGSLVLAALTADVGQSRVEMPVAYDGPPITLTMDHRFVSDFLRVLDLNRSFSVEIEDAESAALFQTDDGYGYVVMPLAKDR